MFHSFAFSCLCCCCLVGVFAGTDELKSVSVMEGDSVSLNSGLTEIQNGDDIIWRFGPNRSLIAITDGVNNMIYDVPNGRFRDRLKLDNKTGSLTIMNITTDHTGVYEVKISGISSSSTYRFTVTVYAPLPVPVISNSSHCSSSSSCSLVCSSVVNVSHATLSWYAGMSVLSSISASDLSISLSLPLEVEYQDKNTYSCVLNNPISSQTTHLDITQFCHSCAGVFAGTDELKSVSVMEGDSVSLNSDLTEIQNGDDIFWKFGPNGSLIAETDGVKNTISDVLDGIFRNRLKLDKKTGSLTIMNITNNHTGVYEVKISSSSSSSTHRFTVTVYGE
ncbi:SLAM family member 5-like [Pimephales promelas]|uniref:SLAM family member 5-like n=1 Tax=Pimephales promelas TaxID=90988 RepID=UPI0019559E0D|nr:SLAM family member 5-like [Pimephales promelas]